MNRFRRLALAVAVLALGIVSSLVTLPTQAAPTYTAQDVQPVALFNFADMGIYVLTIMGSALAAVGLFKISVGIGKKVIAWFGGRA